MQKYRILYQYTVKNENKKQIEQIEKLLKKASSKELRLIHSFIKAYLRL